MDKQILEQYIDACELIKDTKEEIRKLRKHRSQIQQDSVKGSAHEFPYTLQTYHWRGLGMQPLRIRMSWTVWRSYWRSGSGTQRRLSARWKHGLIQSHPECSGLSGIGYLRN